ncbi:FimV/HubP family polar landmark protein [Vibrio mediterranei]
MHHFLKPLLVTLALAGATTSFSISADTIRLTGPNGEALAAPQFSQPIRNQVTLDSDTPARYYGPTKVNETLWSIASRFKPADATVQQTIYAFYQLNPAVFEQNNIHKLVPNSELRIPSDAQINRVDLQEALAVLAAHQNKLNSAATQRKAKVVAESKPEVKPADVKPTVETSATTKSVPSQVTKEKVSDIKPQKGLEQVIPAAKGLIESGEIKPPAQELTQKLQEELTRSESELLSLEERNHQLRLMLSEVQNEVEVLKTEVSNEERIRTEVERQLSEEKRKQAEMARLAPSKLDTWLAKPWFVALLAFVPALLIGLLVMMVLRSRKQKTQNASNQEANISTPSSDVAVATAGVATAAVAVDALDDDNPFSDDLLAGIEEDDDSSQLEVEQQPEDDIFADLNDSDLDFNLDDDDEDPFASIDEDGELDIGFVDLDASNNGISVKDGEKALGLEEMERALNDVAVPDAEDDLDLNLSDTDSEPVSQQELDDLFADFNDTSSTEMADLDSEEPENSLNQADMDELLAGDSFDLESDGDFNLDDLDIETDNKTASEMTPEQADEPVDNADIDDLFAQFSQIDATPEAPQSNTSELAQDEEITLLDDMLDEDFELSDLDDSDLMLDEIVDADEKEATDKEFESSENLDLDDVTLLADEDLELDENNTDLLDELLFESTLGDSTSDEKQAVDLDPFASDDLIGADIDLDSEIEDSKLELSDLEPSNLEPSTVEDESPLAQQPENDDVMAVAESTDVEERADVDKLVEESTAAAAQNVTEEQRLEDDLDLALDAELLPATAEAEQVNMEELDSMDVSSSSQAPAVDAQSQVEEPSKIDDLNNNVPDVDSISDEQGIAEPSLPSSFESEVSQENERHHEAHQQQTSASDNASTAFEDEFDFSPEIEGVGESDTVPRDDSQEQKELEALMANEFGIPQDDDWLIDDENTPSTALEAEVAESSQEQESDDDFLAKALQSEYNEENAFADAEGDAEDTLQPDSELAADFAMADDELPEYSEEDALADVLAGQPIEQEASEPSDVSEAEIEAVLHDIELPEEVEVAHNTESDIETAPQSDATQTVPEREPIEEFDFPDYTEEDAYADSEQAEPELVHEPLVQDEITDGAISLEDLPEYDESQAAADMESSASEREPSFAVEQDMVGETLDHSEIDALADAFSMVDMSAIEQEGQLGELLQEGEQAFSNISPVDQTTADSAGMDLGVMLQDSPDQEGGEDWNGFSLTDEQRASIDHQIPDEEQEIWNNTHAGSLVDASEEDWASQDPVADFEDSADQFMTIDELMAQVDDNASADEEEELKLDVGLDEFPDVIGPITEVDVDSDSEAAGNLDLAKIYIEMNDFEGAVKLLEKALLEGSGNIQSEAKALLAKLSEYQ